MTFKVIYKKQKYDVTLPIDETVLNLKDHINTLTGRESFFLAGLNDSWNGCLLLKYICSVISLLFSSACHMTCLSLGP